MQISPININSNYTYGYNPEKKLQDKSPNFKSSYLYNPNFIVNKYNPLFQHLNQLFNKSVVASRRTWLPIKQTLLPYVNRVEFEKKPGSKLEVWDINKDDRKKYVIVMHGLSNNISSMQNLYENIIDKTNFGILAQEYSGLRESDTKDIYLNPKSLMEDSKAGLKYLLDKGIKKEDICVLGHSFGSFVATGLVSKEKDLNSLILVAPMSSMKYITTGVRYGKFSSLLPSVDINKLMKKHKIFSWKLSRIFSTTNLIKKVEVPIDIIHAEQDKMLNIDDIISLAKKNKHLESLQILSNGKHRMDQYKIDAIVSLLSAK